MANLRTERIGEGFKPIHLNRDENQHHAPERQRGADPPADSRREDQSADSRRDVPERTDDQVVPQAHPGQVRRRDDDGIGPGGHPTGNDLTPHPISPDMKEGD